MRMPQPPTLVLAATLVLAVCAPGRAAPDLTPPWPSVQRLADIAGTRVTFPSSSPFVLSDRRASCEAPTAAFATLFLPPGASAQSPAPAAIILHGAAGVMWARELTYARQLASMGVAALVIDAFAARRERASRFIDRLIEITEAMVLADAFAGLRYLAGRADVDAGRVALIGFSYGGMAATYAAYDQVARRFAPGGERFAGHVAFYAPCIVTFRDNRATGAPVLMLFGGRDAIVDRGRCEGTAGALRSGGAPVEVVVYEDAYHQWDGRFARPREIGRNLAGCRLVVERDGGVHDGRWLLPMINPWTRKLILALCADQAGYLIGRDDDVRARSRPRAFPRQSVPHGKRLAVRRRRRAARERACMGSPLGLKCVQGGWRWTGPSPTRSGPEGSSRNEPGPVRSFSPPPRRHRPPRSPRGTGSS